MKPIIEAIPFHEDNLAWLIRFDDHAFVVDPGDADAILDRVFSTECNIDGILITHHHADHTGGLDKIVKLTGAKVYGPADRRLSRVTHKLGDGDTIEASVTVINVLSVPGHSSDHLAYYMGETGYLFTGDVLFAGGCGRIFEGSPFEMLSSLKRLAALPPATMLCCGHDYTLSNLAFALTIDRNNKALGERFAAVSKRPCFVPETLAMELETNPFLRCGDAEIRALLGEDLSELEIFTKLRSLKNLS